MWRTPDPEPHQAYSCCRFGAKCKAGFGCHLLNRCDPTTLFLIGLRDGSQAARSISGTKGVIPTSRILQLTADAELSFPESKKRLRFLRIKSVCVCGWVVFPLALMWKCEVPGARPLPRGGTRVSIGYIYLSTNFAVSFVETAIIQGTFATSHPACCVTFQWPRGPQVCACSTYSLVSKLGEITIVLPLALRLLVCCKEYSDYA